jgi:acyl-CoA synthetase (NDP forming)
MFALSFQQRAKWPLHKPIILLKGGRTELGAKVAQNTPYYANEDYCNDEVFSAALKRCGVFRVDNIQQFFGMATVLGKQPQPEETVSPLSVMQQDQAYLLRMHLYLQAEK